VVEQAIGLGSVGYTHKIHLTRKDGRDRGKIVVIDGLLNCIKERCTFMGLMEGVQ
jgi:hypothetical protein